MNIVTIKLSIHKDDNLYFYHVHSFSDFDIKDFSSRDLLLDYLRNVDSLINPNHSFISVLEVVASSAFVDDDFSLTFKSFGNHKFRVAISVV